MGTKGACGRVLAGATALAVLAACGSGGGQGVTVTAQIPVTVTAEAASSAASVPSMRSAPASSPASPSSQSASPVPLGSSQTWGDVTMTVHAVDRNAPAETSLDSDKPRTAVDIEACANAPGVKVSGIRWALQDSNGGRYTPDSYTINPVLPEYPTDRGVDVLNGECFRGWLVIQVPQSAPLTMVRYTPVDVNTNEPLATLFWSIPA